jgi:hypothetical protein
VKVRPRSAFSPDAPVLKPGAVNRAVPVPTRLILAHAGAPQYESVQWVRRCIPRHEARFKRYLEGVLEHQQLMQALEVYISKTI